MYGDVDIACQQRLLDLLGKKALAATGLRKRAILNAVTRGANDLDVVGVGAGRVRGGEPASTSRA